MTNVQPADFVVMPAAPPAGPAIEVVQWLQQVIDERRLRLPQKYEHAEVYVGMADKAGPYGYTCSAYPNRKGMRALPCPAGQLPGALWSSGAIPLTQQQRAGIVDWCLAHQAVPYSSLDYLALLGHTFGLDTDWLQHYIQDQSHMICSQYTDTAYSIGGGVQLFTNKRWPGFVTPLDLALLLESRGVRPI